MEEVITPYDGLIKVYDSVEGAELIRQSARNSQMIVKGKGERRRYYYNVVMSFDIETTKVENLNFDPKKDPECLHFFNICFCWQCSVDGNFIFGRYIKDFFEMLDVAAESLNGYIICYIHNIAYEYNNLADFFNAGVQDAEQDIFFKTMSTPLYIRYKKAFEFRCSKMLTAKSLAGVGKDIGYHKLSGDFDYNIQRTEETELSALEINYCYRDVMILDKYISKEYKDFCKFERIKKEGVAQLPLTSTGYPRYSIKKHFSNTGKGRMILKECELAEHEYRFIAPAMWGGFTHENFRYVGDEISDAYHVDICSAYPAAICLKLFPYHLTRGATTDTAVFLQNLYSTDRAVIANITLKNVQLKKGGIPYIPTAKIKAEGMIEENGKLLYADKLTITACDVDIKIILRAYTWDDLQVNEWFFGFKKRLPYAVVNEVIKYFAGKTQYKNVEGMELDYNLSKRKLNGIYGLSATALIHTVIQLIKGEVVAGDEKYEAAKVLPYQWAIYITAYVRDLIYSMVEQMQKNNSFIYSDTDSIFFKYDFYAMEKIRAHNRNVKKELEALQPLFYNIIPKSPGGEPQYLFSLAYEDSTEDTSDIEAFCTIGAKRYYIKHKSTGAYDITFSGLRATKSHKDQHGWHNGYNTDRLIKMYGTLNNAFQEIKKGSVALDYVEGIDKLSNYNIRADFRGKIGDKVYHRPCTYTLYPQSIRLSLNPSLKAFLISERINDYE